MNNHTLASRFAADHDLDVNDVIELLRCASSQFIVVDCIDDVKPPHDDLCISNKDLFKIASVIVSRD